jgi:uncharacterized DUF497 family protein
MEYGEARYRAIGMAESLLMTVFYTQRGVQIRIISARAPTRKEQKIYAQYNPPK